MLLAAGALVTARDNVSSHVDLSLSLVQHIWRFEFEHLQAGRTALHRASYWRVPEHVHVVAALLDHPGVDPCAIDIVSVFMQFQCVTYRARASG